MSIPARRLLAPGILLACLLVPFFLPLAPTADDAASQGPFPPLDTRVMVPDLEPPLTVPDPLPTEAIADAAPRRSSEKATEAAIERTNDPEISPPLVTLSPPEPIAPPPSVPLRVMLDWYLGPQHAALLLAHERGLFAHRDLTVQLITPADPDVPLRLLAAKRIDLAVTRQPQLHLQAGRGLPVTRIATLVGTPLAGLILRHGTDLESPAQLAGKRIGYADEDSRDILLPALLEPHGIDLAELELTNLNFRLATGLVAGEVDGVIGGMRLQLLHQVGDQGVATRMLRIEELGIPTHEGLILVANRDRLSAQRDVLRRFVAALEEATAWIIEHPDAAWRQLVAAAPGVNTPANRSAWPATLLRLSTRPGALDQTRYATFEAFLHPEAPTPLERLAVDLGAP